MSDDVEEEQLGEGGKEVPGEGGPKSPPGEPATRFPVTAEVINEKKLTFQEASRCLNTLGKDESGARYAYIMMTATDRKLTDVSIILKFKHVLFVDVSNNYLNMEALQVLADMPFMVLLKASTNRVESAALKQMYFLQVLDLTKNQITETCDINQPMLECLVLNYNEIYTAQFDKERLGTLKQLELRGNHLFDISGSYPISVVNLYLAENRISRITAADLGKLENLKILHLRDNQIRKLDGFSDTLANLSYLNIRKNKINKLRQFRKLAGLRRLETLVFSDNPVSGYVEAAVIAGEGGGGGGGGVGGGEDEEEEMGEDGPPEDKTRISILVMLPNLKRINKLLVTLDEKNRAYDTRDEKLEQIMAEDSSEDETDMPTTTDFTTDYTVTSETGVENATTVDDEDEDDEEN